jgi:plasmid stabilization system protein ParE
MKVEFLDPAETEMIEAVDYYNAEGEALGYEFAAEVSRTIMRIVAYPRAWASLSKNTRRCRMNRFPYGVIYQVRNDNILIVAIMHLRRNPQSWKDRLSPGGR